MHTTSYPKKATEKKNGKLESVDVFRARLENQHVITFKFYTLTHYLLSYILGCVMSLVMLIALTFLAKNYYIPSIIMVYLQRETVFSIWYYNIMIRRRS